MKEEASICDSIKLKMAVAMTTIRDVERGEDLDGEWLDVLGICKLTHEMVRRRVFDNGDVMQHVHPSGWVHVDMRSKAEFNREMGRQAVRG